MDAYTTFPAEQLPTNYEDGGDNGSQSGCVIARTVR